MCQVIFHNETAMTFARIFQFLVVVQISVTTIVLADISDKRSCADEQCTEIVSLGKTLLRYNSIDSRILSFPANADVKIYSKEAGTRLDLWGAEINGKRGYVPKQTIRETKIITNQLKYLVPTDERNADTLAEPQTLNNDISPDPTVGPYEIISGTTIYHNFPPSFSSETDQEKSHYDKQQDVPLELNNSTKAEKPQVPEENESKTGNTEKLGAAEMKTESKESETKTESEEVVTENAFEDIGLNESNTENTKKLTAAEMKTESEASETKTELKESEMETESIETEMETESVETGTKTESEEIVSNESNTENTEKLTAAEMETESVETGTKTESEEIVSNESNTENTEKLTAAEMETESKESETKMESEEIVQESAFTETVSNENEIENTEKLAAAEMKTESIETEMKTESKEIVQESASTEIVSSESNTENTEKLAAAEMKTESIETEMKTESEEIVQESASTEIVSSESNTENTEKLTAAKMKTESETKIEENAFEEIVSNENEIENTESKGSQLVNETSELDSLEIGPIVESLTSQKVEEVEREKNEGIGGYFSQLFFAQDKLHNDEIVDEKQLPENCQHDEYSSNSHVDEKPVEKYLSECADVKPDDKMQWKEESLFVWDAFVPPESAYFLFLYLSLTSVTVLLFTLGYYFLEKRRNDGALIANINYLEQQLLVSTKENVLMRDELQSLKGRESSDELIGELQSELAEAKAERTKAKGQIAKLEKDLEIATETALDLNRMLTDFMKVDQLEKHRETIDALQSKVDIKNTEIELLQTELSVTNEKFVQVQEEMNKMVGEILSARQDKLNVQTRLEEQIAKLKTDYECQIKQCNEELRNCSGKNTSLRQTVDEMQRSLDLRNKECTLLQQRMKEMAEFDDDGGESLESILDVSRVKAELLQLQEEKSKLSTEMQKEVEQKVALERKAGNLAEELQKLSQKLEETDREKVEAKTRLEVLSTYFKDREAQLQKELQENESKFLQKEGEATSTVERIKWIQEELQNYKLQNELLKKEILDQEVCLKSQISVLEKKSHDNWLLCRQAERRLEESRHEASLLRNRLTLVEKNLNNTAAHLVNDSKIQNHHANGDNIQMEAAAAGSPPPLLFRDHMTTTPPLPPPFMPPPFMPPPIPGVPPFMPPPPSAMFPGDHRPPPLGRMSSPLHGRYSPPDPRAFSPPYRDDSPPLSPASGYYRRGKSARRPLYWDGERTLGNKSSASENSNDSLDGRV